MYMLGRRTDTVHVYLCEGMQSNAERTYGRTPSLAISNRHFIQAPSGQLPTRKGDAPLRLGFISNLTAEKGLDTALELASRVSKTRAGGVVLAVAGPVNDTSVVPLLRDPLVSYCGPVHAERKEKFFNSIDYLLFPTRYRHEAEPLVVIEAVSRGVPVLATEIGCIPELLRKAKYCHAYPEESWVDLASALLNDGLDHLELKQSVGSPLWLDEMSALGSLQEFFRVLAPGDATS